MITFFRHLFIFVFISYLVVWLTQTGYIMSYRSYILTGKSYLLHLLQLKYENVVQSELNGWIWIWFM